MTETIARTHSTPTVRFGDCKSGKAWSAKAYDRRSVDTVSDDFLKFVCENKLVTKMQRRPVRPVGLGNLTLIATDTDMEFLEKIYQIHLDTLVFLKFNTSDQIVKLKAMMTRAENMALSLYTVLYIRKLFLECLKGEKSVSEFSRFVM